jgi:hypothetical protein
MKLDEDLRTMLRERAEGVNAAPVIPDATVSRVRVRKTMIAGAVGVGVATVALAGVLVVSTIADESPAPPAERNEREAPLPGPGRNGTILHSEDGNGPEEGSTPTGPDVAPGQEGVTPYDAWAAFDQTTESFLFIWPYDSKQVWVVGANGPTAKFICPPSTECGVMDSFGPGSDEVTVADSDPRSVNVIGFDGTVRETLDLSEVVTDSRTGPYQEIADIQWSPDGSRLAVSTNNSNSCDDRDICDANVWIIERDGGKPQWVFTTAADDSPVKGVGTPNPPSLRDLAWSPNGDSLAFLSAPVYTKGRPRNKRLVVLRLQSGEAVHGDTLHTYDDRDWRSEGLDALLETHYHLHFAFAWSPDGTRMAVTSEGGIAEISAEDGSVLARHPGEEIHGPLAWLRKR